jgi:hypothetical protein
MIALLDLYILATIQAEENNPNFNELSPEEKEKLIQEELKKL